MFKVEDKCEKDDVTSVPNKDSSGDDREKSEQENKNNEDSEEKCEKADALSTESEDSCADDEEIEQDNKTNEKGKEKPIDIPDSQELDNLSSKLNNNQPPSDQQVSLDKHNIEVEQLFSAGVKPQKHTIVKK